MRPPKARRILIAVYEGVSLLDLAGPLEAFRVASDFGGSREGRVTYECSVVSIRGGPLKTANGVELVTESVRSVGRDPIDTLIIPGAFAVEDVTRDRALLRWVRDRSPSCRRVCSVCIGSFLLAAAGVLDGRRAATHWLHAPLLAERYPRVTVEPDAIFIRDGPVWSSAGVTTGIAAGILPSAQPSPQAGRASSPSLRHRQPLTPARPGPALCAARSSRSGRA